MKIILHIALFFLISLNSKAQTECSSPNFDYNGYCYDYHSNGQIAWVKEFKEGLATGIWMKFDDKGNLLLQLNTRDKQDSLGKIYLLKQNKLTGKEVVCGFDGFGAEYPGGAKAMQEFINKNIIYPEKAIEFDDWGTVHLAFIVETDGTLTNLRVEKGASEDLDAEALRLLSIMPKWIPGEENGKKTISRVRLPIKFTIAE